MILQWLWNLSEYKWGCEVVHGDKEYYLITTEMIARSYAQYIAMKPGNAKMKQQLDDPLAGEKNTSIR